MVKVIFKFFFVSYSLLSILILVGCGGSKSTNTKADLERDFNKSNSIPALKASILTIPENVQLVAEASSGKISKISKKNKSLANNGLGENMYGSITSTIKHAEQIKSNIAEFLEFIFTEKNLAAAELGLLVETEAGTITAYKIEDVSGVEGESFKWKLSLYFTFSSVPSIICRFTFLNGKMKGQMLQTFKESTSITVGNFPRIFYRYYYYDIRFDGTTLPQKLDIDYVVDLSEVIRFAEQYWPQISDEEFDSLDLGQTGSASIRVQFDGTEYGISGANYSPGANTKSLLSRELKLFGEDRSTYSFRAKSITGTVDGAKMEVALPIDELEDVSTIWETDSFSKLFANEILEFLDEYIAQLIDNTDDEYINNSDYLGTAILNSVSFDGTPLEEKRIGFNVLYSYLGNQLAIPSLSTHGNVVTTAEFEAAVTFWGSDAFTDLGTSSLLIINNFLANEVASSAEKEKVYYQVMAPTVIEYYQTNPNGITLSDVEVVLTAVNDFGSNAFLELIATNKLIVNPAFFEKDKGFLGTFDGINFNTFDWFEDTLMLGTKPTNFDILNALDLSELEAIIPKEVKGLVIEVK